MVRELNGKLVTYKLLVMHLLDVSERVHGGGFFINLDGD